MTVGNVVDRGTEFVAVWWWLLLIAIVALGSVLYWWIASKKRPQISGIPPSLLAGHMQKASSGYKADSRGPAGGRRLRIGQPPPAFPDGPVVGIADKPRLPLADHGASDLPPAPPLDELHITIDLTALESEPDEVEPTIDLRALSHLTSLPADPWA